jgi:hypothetical protein
MAQLGPLYSNFPCDRSARQNLHDQLHKSLTSSGVATDLIAIAGDSSRTDELRQHLAEELRRISALHQGNSGANIRLEFDATGNITVKKGIASNSNLAVADIPSGWLEGLRHGYETATCVTNTSGFSPSPVGTSFATVERPSGAVNDSYCPFSTPPEFRGFDASPLAADDHIRSPNVLD